MNLFNKGLADNEKARKAYLGQPPKINLPLGNKMVNVLSSAVIKCPFSFSKVVSVPTGS